MAMDQGVGAELVMDQPVDMIVSAGAKVRALEMLCRAVNDGVLDGVRGDDIAVLLGDVRDLLEQTTKLLI